MESLYIVNPLSGKGVAGLFSTHPPLAERIRRLLVGHLLYRHEMQGRPLLVRQGHEKIEDLLQPEAAGRVVDRGV